MTIDTTGARKYVTRRRAWDQIFSKGWWGLWFQWDESPPKDWRKHAYQRLLIRFPVYPIRRPVRPYSPSCRWISSACVQPFLWKSNSGRYSGAWEECDKDTACDAPDFGQSSPCCVSQKQRFVSGRLEWRWNCRLSFDSRLMSDWSHCSQYRFLQFHSLRQRRKITWSSNLPFKDLEIVRSFFSGPNFQTWPLWSM